MMDPLSLLIVVLLIGLVPATIAQRKGHGFIPWWLFGAAFFILALPLALMLKPNPSRFRSCPLCRTTIPIDARVCPQCSRDVYEHLARTGGE